MIEWVEPLPQDQTYEDRVVQVAEREQFIVDSWEVKHREGYGQYLYIAGHFDSCMWCGSTVPPGRTHCPSCASKVGMADRING